MIRYSLPSSCRARLGAAGTLALIGLAALPLNQAKAVLADPAAVVTGDTFSFEMIGYNTNTPGGDFYAIAENLTTTFGTTQTYTNDTLVNGQVLTVTSSETRNGNVFTDNIQISVPGTFIPAGTTDNNGNVVNALEFSIGNYNVPMGGTFDTLDYTTAINLSSVTGTLGYTNGGKPGSLGLTNTTTLSNGGASFSSEEAGQTPKGGDVSAYSPSSFTYTITYQAVPEPSTDAAILLGAGALLWITVARRRHPQV